jgi:hypothetical protein
MTLLNQLISNYSAHSCDVGGVSNISTPVTKKVDYFTSLEKFGLCYLTYKK